MRWMFAMLIALFCWTGSVSGQKLCAASPKANPTALNNLPLLADASPSPSVKIYRAPAEARRKAPGKLPQLLPRAHCFHGSLLTAVHLIRAYTLATELGYPVRPPRRDAPAPNRLAQVDWRLHSSRQQSRLGSWKESNMLYRGTLTYHS